MYSVNRRESGRHFHIDSDDKKYSFKRHTGAQHHFVTFAGN